MKAFFRCLGLLLFLGIFLAIGSLLTQTVIREQARRQLAASGAAGGSEIPYANSLDVFVNTATDITLMSSSETGNYQIVTPPAHGQVNEPTGSVVTYTPDQDYLGPDSFTFSVDQSSRAETVWLTVVARPSDLRPDREAQTLIPTVTPAHWQTSSSFSSSDQVTKADYLSFITTTYDRRRPGNDDHFYDYDLFLYNAFFYKSLGGSSYLQNALGYLDSLYRYYTVGASSTDPNYAFRRSDFGHTLGAFNWINDDIVSLGSSTEAKARILKLEEKAERFNPPDVPWQFGAGNQSFGPAAARKIIATLYPNDPDSPERESMANQIWHDWSQYADTFENASNYNALFNTFVLDWLDGANSTEKSSLYDSADFKAYTNRFLAQVSPIGIIPSYGDSFGFGTSPGSWINIFERWAAIYKNRDQSLASQFRWAAKGAYDWSRAQAVPMDFWGNLSDTTIKDVMRTWMAVDDSIATNMPQSGSTITYRHDVTMNSDTVRDQTGYPAVIKSNLIPDKLILRNGWGPQSFFAMFELAPPLGHSHYDTGSLNSLVAGGSYLLGDTSYAIKDHRFHNTFQVVPQGTETYSNNFDVVSAMRTTVSLLQESALGTVAEFSIAHYLGRPLTLTRTIFMVPDPVSREPYLWVRDRIIGDRAGAFVGNIGPAWETEAIYGSGGDSWANTTYLTIPVAYFAREEYITQWNNQPYDLTVVFPTGAGTMTVDNVTHDTTHLTSSVDEQNTAKYRIWNKTATTLGMTGENFSSLLLPHAPSPDASSLVNAFSALRDDSGATILKQSKGATSVYLGVNDSGNQVDFDGLKTDASRFIITVSGGTVNYYLENASLLSKDGGIVISANAKQRLQGSGTPVTSTSGSGSGGLISGPVTNTSSSTVKLGAAILPLTAPRLTGPRLTGPFAYGMTSDQVKVLQGMLAQDPTLYPSAKITGHYDVETAKAVSIFQKRYNIVSSGLPNTTGFGLAGPVTRAKLNEIFGSKTSSSTFTNLSAAQKQVLTAEVESQIKLLQLKLLQALIQLRIRSNPARP